MRSVRSPTKDAEEHPEGAQMKLPDTLQLKAPGETDSKWAVKVPWLLLKLKLVTLPLIVIVPTSVPKLIGVPNTSYVTLSKVTDPVKERSGVVAGLVREKLPLATGSASAVEGYATITDAAASTASGQGMGRMRPPRPGGVCQAFS